MSINKIEIQDSDGNIYYPHTDASVVKIGDSNVEDVFGQLNIIQTAGGSATAIILSDVNLVKGFTTSFIVATNNNGAATTINGKNLFKFGGNTAPTLTAGKFVTVWFNGTNFFIKASAEGNAVAEHVLAGEIFSTDADTGITGNATNNGPTEAETVNLTTQNQEYTIASGFHSGLRKIKAVITNLVASVIKYGETVGGVVGTFTSDASAIANHIFSGQSAYVKGSKVTGTSKPRGINLAYNGSFERAFAGYTTTGNVSHQNVYYKDGSFGAALTAYTNAEGSVSQVINTVVGHIYYVACWYYVMKDYIQAGSGDVFLQFGTGNSKLTYPNINTGVWMYTSFQYTATATATTLTAIAQKYATGTIMVDCLIVEDLTDSFGSGAEPSISDLSFYSTNYFEDATSKLFNGKLTAYGEEVLAGKVVVSGNGYIQTGSMKNNTFAALGNNAYITANAKADGLGDLCFAPTQRGYYDTSVNSGGFGILMAYDPNYVAANILSGKSIFGLVGNAPRVAWGIASADTYPTTHSFKTDAGSGVLNAPGCQVTGLSFEPEIIILKSAYQDTSGLYQDGDLMTVYKKRRSTTTGFVREITYCCKSLVISGMTGSMFALYTKAFVATNNDAYVNSNSFLLPSPTYGANLVFWLAISVGQDEL